MLTFYVAAPSVAAPSVAALFVAAPFVAAPFLAAPFVAAPSLWHAHIASSNAMPELFFFTLPLLWFWTWTVAPIGGWVFGLFSTVAS